MKGFSTFCRMAALFIVIQNNRLFKKYHLLFVIRISFDNCF